MLAGDERVSEHPGSLSLAIVLAPLGTMDMNSEQVIIFLVMEFNHA